MLDSLQNITRVEWQVLVEVEEMLRRLREDKRRTTIAIVAFLMVGYCFAKGKERKIS